jgi:VWFA-related protein
MVVRCTAVLAATLILTSYLAGQTPGAGQIETSPLPVLETGTKIVVLDVVVQDGSGKPVHGLSAANFQLTEGKGLQKIGHVEEHTPPPSASLPALGPMPAGTFTDYTPVPPGSALNVLLLDSLNTPMMYQKWVRDQLVKYIQEAPAGQRIAIFGLTDELVLLQGFTTDPAVLRDALDEIMAKKSPLQHSDGPTTANVRRFVREEHAIETEVRIKTTLDAFNAMAHYLAGFPGRKNLIWFSGSFPTGAFAGPSDPHLLNEVDNDNEITETTATLAAAQVSVYPIDARGLMVDPMLTAGNNSRSLTAANPRGLRLGINQFSETQAQEHATMESLAAETGGKAFYNTNGIVGAVQEAIKEGSNYYTLSYSPTDHNWNGSYRTIHVKLVDGPGDVKLSYRPGYFATAPKPPARLSPAELSAGIDTVDPHHRKIYDRAALERGAPTPQDVLFKVRVLPASHQAEEKLAPGNTLDPAAPAQGPYRRYDVDFALEPTELTLVQDANGVHSGQVKFTVYVYDAEGHLLVAAHRGFNLNLKPDFYAKFIKADLQCHMEVSVPEKAQAYLRIAVEDIPADRFGAVEMATASVEDLPPPSYGRPPAKNQ